MANSFIVGAHEYALYTNKTFLTLEFYIIANIFPSILHVCDFQVLQAILINILL